MKHGTRIGIGLFASLGTAAVLLLVPGCAQQTPIGQEAGGMGRVDTPLQDVKGLPSWVLKGGGGETIEGRRVLQGVGSVSGIINPTLRRKSAGAQARTDLAAMLQVYVAGLNKQYMAETTAGDFSQHDVEQRVQDTMKQVTDATLVGVQIVEYWEHPLKNEAFALARLDIEEFKNVMKNYAVYRSRFLGHGYCRIWPDRRVAGIGDRRSWANSVRRVLRGPAHKASTARRSTSSCGLRRDQ